MGMQPYRTVVDNAATSRALIEASTVFDEMGVTPTATQTQQMEAAILQISGLIDRFLDRVLVEEDVTDHFRKPCSQTLRLSRYPVSNLLEVVENGTTLTDSDYELDDASGTLWRISDGDVISWADTGAITVSYSGGYIVPTNLPADIQRAVIEQSKATYLAGSRDPNIRSFTVPDVYQAAYNVGGGDSFGKSGLLVQVEGALLAHRRLSA